MKTPVTPETKEAIDLQEILSTVRAMKTIELNDNQWDKDFVFTNDEAKQAILEFVTQRELQSQIKILEKAHRLDGQMDYDNETDEYIDTLIDSLKAQLGESNDI